MTTNNSIQWWGYIHVDGSIHVKRYFSREDLVEARESDFVQQVFGPWEVDSREKALEKMKQYL
jgi:hypothetical protein